MAQEISRLIKTLNTKKAIGLDKILVAVLKIITQIYLNLSKTGSLLSEGEMVPKIIKESTVCSVFKNVDEHLSLLQ